MADERATVTGMTLPPKVVGEVSGHLVMKVDEVLWARKPPEEVSAVVMWWGGEEPTTFRPTDVAQESVRKRNAGVIYEIRTSLALFEKYLRKCSSLEIAMADKYGMPIGCVSISNLWKMIGTCPYQGYYPIINNFGNRIGDLHVSFNLRMAASTDTSSVIKIKPTTNKKTVKAKELKEHSSEQQPHFTKEAKTKKNEKVVNDNLLKPEVSRTSQQTSDSNDQYFVDVEIQDSVQNRVSPTSNIISQILEHGTKLRDAMTASVMEDGVQLDLKSIPNFDILSSDILKDVRHSQSLNSFPSSNIHLGSSSQNPFVKKISPVSEKKVLDYLSGKPMSLVEEEEALSALRNITPTKDIIESVVPETCGESQVEESSKARKNVAKDSAELVGKGMDSNEKNSPHNKNECCFEVDSQTLSQINCLRVTVHSLVLNSVGIKRIGSAPKKKGSLSHSNILLHPPGVTYFVEYKFPWVSESRSWESSVRYCSKRFNGHEVSFGDRTVHNIPETWRCSIPEETNLCSLISALSFKVCARHLHQRVPLCLGTAAPNSAKELLNSLNLRYDFDLPVIATDCLPVAQLKICLELGRDRIHFGGLLDPDNNSLGIRSPRKTSLKKSQLSIKNSSYKKIGRSVTTVTRNINSKHSSSTYKWQSGVPQKASQADQVIKRLVTHANNAAKPSYLSDTSSAPSSARLKLKPNKSLPLSKHQSSIFEPGRKSSLAKQNDDVPNFGQILKHELAVTIIQVIDSNYLTSSIAEDRGFYVSYKFPVSNTMKNDSVDWNSCCTEPSEGDDGTWPKSQNRIHTVVLPQQKSFHGFLEQAFKLHGMQKRACVVFTLNIRAYCEEVRDLKVAEAYLPLTCMLTLEDAYNDASKNNTNFSQSSCSSVVLDLPFEDLSSYHCQKPTENSGSLRLKLDYRHSYINLMQKDHLPRSRGDSITENLPCYDFAETQYQKQKPEIEVVLSQSFDSSASAAVPNWAQVKKLPSSLREDTFLIGQNASPKSYCTGDFNYSSSHARNPHASWEPVGEKADRSRLLSRMSDSAYQLTSSRNPEEQSIVDVIDITKEISQCALDKTSHSVNVSSQLSVEGPLDRTTPLGKVKKVVDAVTSTTPSIQHRHTSSRGTSPIASSELVSEKSACVHMATSTEKVPARDKSQQVIIESASQGSQTSPREIKETAQTDGEAAADIIRILPGNHTSEQLPSISTTAVLPQQSTDDVETVKVVSEQELVSNACVLTESSKETLQVSQEIPSVREVAKNTNETSNFAASTFQAKIGVECALHLQTEPRGEGRNANSLVFVSINPCGVDGRISAHMGLNPVSISPAVENNGEPEWHWETEVSLPVDLLISAVKRLIFKLWLKDRELHHGELFDNSPACLIGFSALDLTVLSVGLPFISGWYNVMDFSGACRGQIKLSVEPLENISALVDLSSLCYSNDTPQSNCPLSMFVAHCAYPEFPSHVTQFPDMRVQKVDPQPSDQAMSAVLSGYQLVTQHCQRKSSDQHTKPHEPIDNLSRSKSPSRLKRTNNTLVIGASLPSVGQQNVPPGGTVSAPSALQPNAAACRLESAVEVEKDPSVLLREKLSELDSITESIKARVLNRVDSSKMFGSMAAPFGVRLSEGTENHPEIAHNHFGAGGEPVELERDQCYPCACHQSANVCSDKTHRWHKNTEEAFGDRHSDITIPISINERNRGMQKQRRMWERHENLIDFGSLSIEDEDEQSPHNEDVSEWLTEAALQQVFNPFLFNDILNSMNSSRGGVQVIELEDTENSDNNDTEAAAPADVELEDSSGLQSKCCRKRSRRGDETYRKENSHFSSNQNASNHHIRSGTAACDADSGVDVDLSANFHLSSCKTAATRQFYSSHIRNNMGVQPTRSERDESSSCSLSSRHQQSTGPSTASATPSDSPQHVRHRKDGQQNATQGRQCSGTCSNQHRRN